MLKDPKTECFPEESAGGRNSVMIELLDLFQMESKQGYLRICEFCK